MGNNNRLHLMTMLRLNDPNFNAYGRLRRFSPLNKRLNVIDPSAIVVEYFEPVTQGARDSLEAPWKPFKLINDSRGVAYTFNVRMRWVDIVREVLKDNTSSSNLGKLVRGECKTVNGWRCELL